MELGSSVSLLLRTFANFRRVLCFNESIDVLQKLFVFGRTSKKEQLNLLRKMLRATVNYFYVLSLMSLYAIFSLEVENF